MAIDEEAIDEESLKNTKTCSGAAPRHQKLLICYSGTGYCEGADGDADAINGEGCKHLSG